MRTILANFLWFSSTNRILKPFCRAESFPTKEYARFNPICMEQTDKYPLNLLQFACGILGNKTNSRKERRKKTAPYTFFCNYIFCLNHFFSSSAISLLFSFFLSEFGVRMCIVQFYRANGRDTRWTRFIRR